MIPSPLLRKPFTQAHYQLFMISPSALPDHPISDKSSPEGVLPEGVTLLQGINFVDVGLDIGVDPAALNQRWRGNYATVDLLVSAQEPNQLRQIQVVIDPQQIPAEATVIDGQDWFMGSGLVDLYSTSGEPGYESRETLDSFQQAARAGGFGLVGILPHTEPVLDDVGALEFLTHHSPTSAKGLRTHLKPWGALTHKTAGKQLNDLTELSPHVLGFTDGKPLQNLLLVQRALDYLQPLAKPLMLFAQDLQILGDGVVRDGKWCVQYGYSGAPVSAETSALAALLEIIQPHHGPVHLMRISTARSVALLRQAKAAGLPITASVTWAHLCYCDQDLHSYDPSLHLMPPLGSAMDRDALVAGIKDGTIDAIAVDHTPYTYEEKAVPFDSAPAGAAGLEVAWVMLWQKLVGSGQLTPLELWRAMSTGALGCVGLKPTELDFRPFLRPFLFSSTNAWQVQPDQIHSLAYNLPCWRQRLHGRVVSCDLKI